MGRTSGIILLVIACLVLLGDRLLLVASAQPSIPNGVFVRESSGTTWLIVRGQKAQVDLFQTTDEAIAAIPDSGQRVVPGGDGQTGLALGAPAAPANAQAPANPPTQDEPVGRMLPSEGAAHAEQDTPITYRSRPPTSGTHYPTWVQNYGVLDPAPPTGNWVHNLEHGAVVILYNCPSACPELVQQLKDLYPTLPLGRNSRGGRPRVLIVPYADMDTKIAAVAWQWLLQQDELDVDQLTQFVEQRIDRGPECTAAGFCP
jgi:hypothetical protein